jgi:hypothetical protein
MEDILLLEYLKNPKFTVKVYCEIILYDICSKRLFPHDKFQFIIAGAVSCLRTDPRSVVLREEGGQVALPFNLQWGTWQTGRAKWQ